MIGNAGKVAAGCGCLFLVGVLVAVVGMFGMIGLGTRVMLNRLSEMPKVNQTAAGVTIDNPSGAALTHVRMTLQAAPRAKLRATAYFYWKAPAIAGHQTVTIPFQQFHAKSGRALSPDQFKIDEFQLDFDNGNMSGSI